MVLPRQEKLTDAMDKIVKYVDENIYSSKREELE